jgi:hypothetical protein
MTDLQTVLTCITALGVAVLLWDASRRWASRDSNVRAMVNDCEGAIIELNEKLEKLGRERDEVAKIEVARHNQLNIALTQITNSMSERRTQLDDACTRITNLTASHADVVSSVETLREDNKAEFLAMKSEFDRFKARDAIEAYNQPRGNNARPY